MDPVLAFVLGGGLALAFRDKLKKAGRSVLIGTVRAKRGVSQVMADMREGLEDIEAEVEHRDKTRAESATTSSSVS